MFRPGVVLVSILGALAGLLVGCGRGDVAPVGTPAAPATKEPAVTVPPPAAEAGPPAPATPPVTPSGLATFGGGCFWCVEAVFERVDGVLAVESGYTGGSVTNPTYQQICTGTTGHAEVVQVRFDPAKVRYETLLEIFFKTHDPTTPNRQGADVGTQYRSAVFFHDPEQRRIALEVKAAIEAAKVYDRPIVTEITPFDRFWKAEDYHQGYYDENPTQGYCRVVITPKVEKLEKLFKDRLKAR